MPSTSATNVQPLSSVLLAADVMRYSLIARTTKPSPMRYNETIPPPCPVRPMPSTTSRAIQRRHSWANAQFQRAFDNDEPGNPLGIPSSTSPSPNAAQVSPVGLTPNLTRPARHSYPRHLPRNHSADSTESREEIPLMGVVSRNASASSRRSKLTRMGSSFDSSMRNSSAAIASKMRSVRDKLRQHAIHQGAHWPPPPTLFTDRYTVNERPTSFTMCSSDRSSVASTPARSRRSFPPRVGPGGLLRRRMSSESDSVYSSDAGDSGGIVCSELDLKAILSDYKCSVGPPTGGSVDKGGSSSGFFSFGCTTPSQDDEPHKRTASEGRLSERSRSFTLISGHKRRHFRKQVSFDDREYYVGHSERKVSAIQEEIELAAMQATQVATSNAGNGACDDMLPSRAQVPSSDDVSPEDDDRGDENRPLLGSGAFRMSGGLQASDSVASAPAATDSGVLVEDEDEPEVSETASGAESPPHQPKEIEYDEHGQTWEIYGAEFDANILGEAIQRHLESMIHKDFGEVFQDDELDATSQSPPSRKGRNSCSSTNTSVTPAKPAPRRASDSEVKASGGEESRSRITRLCSILFCVRGRRRADRNAMR